MPLTLPFDGSPDLPLVGPGGLELLKAQLHIAEDDLTDDETLDTIVAAVATVIRTLPVAGDASAPAADPMVLLEEWPDYITYGATLLGARLFRRRNSPAGVEAFGEFGPVYVQRNDPDIAMMLRLGSWARPGVG